MGPVEKVSHGANGWTTSGGYGWFCFSRSFIRQRMAPVCGRHMGEGQTEVWPWRAASPAGFGEIRLRQRRRSRLMRDCGEVKDHLSASQSALSINGAVRPRREMQISSVADSRRRVTFFGLHCKDRPMGHWFGFAPAVFRTTFYVVAALIPVSRCRRYPVGCRRTSFRKSAFRVGELVIWQIHRPHNAGKWSQPRQHLTVSISI